ncbi:tetratricopeptide repeat protein [Calothrix sp. UHCC 0171]|uniref:tetratricopeptide repeat protein n=1 Tax=Calothrix sp. UHCC 0171 TaxID=3110245 RepID=UPI002B1F25D4|nr:tetratricopeptide repeat protein [Calothrix sp. UHCC 0171]MEA5572347.1 tetratricopeptide repeat protein [Calothrix sp. UHCC 0171]
MDWITILRSLQSDFVNRISSGSLLHCQTEGQHSELTIISGERLRFLRNFCWQMAEKYKRVSPVRDVFTSFLKGKLGEEVVKERLANFITEVDYEKRIGGDGNVDFTLSNNPLVGIEVKSRCGNIDTVKWSVTAEEVAKNTVIVCILIQEKVNEAQAEYHLILAGFLPTEMIKLKTGKITFGIDQLLYGGGLFTYLQQFNSGSQNYLQREKLAIYQHSSHLTSHSHNSHTYEHEEELTYSPEQLIQLYIQTGDDNFARGNYEAAIISYYGALKLNNQLNYYNTEIYYKIAIAKYQFGDYEGAISDCLQVLKLNPNYIKAYQTIGLSRYQIGDCQGAIADFSQAIRINPNYPFAYMNRAYAYLKLGENQAAIEDCTEAIKLNPNSYLLNHNSLNNTAFIDTIKNNLTNHQDFLQVFQKMLEIAPDNSVASKERANYRYDIEDYEGAISDYTEVIKSDIDDIDAYLKRAKACWTIGDKKSALEDYTQALKINSSDADIYFHRGNLRWEFGDMQGAIEDLKKATDLYNTEGKFVEYRQTRELILDLEIEASLDILNF